jgi:hypothetical protein
MNNFAKKAMAVNILVMMVIALLSGFITFNYISSTSDLVSTTAEDSACKTFIAAEGSNIGSLFIFLSDLRLKCKKEEIEIKGEVEKEIFTNVANSMSKCWDRYGKGEYDFLGNFGTEGNWCFACAKLAFEDETKNYDYTSEFIPWTKTNLLKLGNGSKISYHDYLNLKYYNGDEQLLIDISSGINDINNLISDGDPTLTSLVVSMSEKNTELINLAQKRIDTSDNMYVVYRYDRIPKGDLEILGDVALGFVAGFVLEEVLFWGVGALLTVGTFGAAGPVVVAVGVYKTGKKVKQGEKTEKAYSLAQKLVSSTSTAIKTSQKSKVLKTIGIYDGSIKSALKISSKLEKISPDFSKYYLDIGKKLENLGVTNIDKIDDLKSLENSKLGEIEQLRKLVISGKINPNDFKSIDNVQSHLTKINDLDKLKIELSSVGDLTKLGTAEKASYVEKTFTYTRNLFRFGAGVIGATTAVAYNSNNVQYVDLLNKEQYYRLCGTEPIISK